MGFLGQKYKILPPYYIIKSLNTSKIYLNLGDKAMKEPKRRVLDFGEVTSRTVHATGSSYLITLPITFVRRHNLKKGDKVYVEIYDSRLVITPMVDLIFLSEGGVLWFIERINDKQTNKVGMNIVDISALIRELGYVEASRVIREGLIKQGFSKAIRRDKIEEKIRDITLLFIR